MIIWILDSDSGIKLLYKSFLKTDTDEDIISGFLSAFHKFSMVEFQQSLESIEMAGLRWIYIVEDNYKLLFIAAATKIVKTELLMGRLEVIRKAFVEAFDPIWNAKGQTWDGDVSIFLPFNKIIEDYYHQWEEVEDLTQVADLFDILRIFQQFFIMFRNIIENRMYSKSKNLIISRIEIMYNSSLNLKEFKNQPELKNISYAKNSWFNLIDINLIKCDKKLVIDYLMHLLSQIIKILKDVKGRELCFKYFSEEKIYAYIYNNLQFLKDLNLDMYLLDLFLLLT